MNKYLNVLSWKGITMKKCSSLCPFFMILSSWANSRFFSAPSNPGVYPRSFKFFQDQFRSVKALQSCGNLRMQISKQFLRKIIFATYLSFQLGWRHRTLIFQTMNSVRSNILRLWHKSCFFKLEKLFPYWINYVTMKPSLDYHKYTVQGVPINMGIVC